MLHQLVGISYINLIGWQRYVDAAGRQEFEIRWSLGKIDQGIGYVKPKSSTHAVRDGKSDRRVSASDFEKYAIGAELVLYPLQLGRSSRGGIRVRAMLGVVGEGGKQLTVDIAIY